MIEPLKGKPLILVDWGNTLMRDDPSQSGPMCDWPVVEAMPDAAEALRYMAAHFPVALATGAPCSGKEQIMRALQRAGLERWISAIFLSSETGSSKSSPRFYSHIATQLGVKPQQLVMIGDDFANDVHSARQAGLHPFWVPAPPASDRVEPVFGLLQAAHAAVERLAEANQSTSPRC